MRLSTLEPLLELPQRVRFRCPKCGEHQIFIAFGSGEMKWAVSGSTVEDLTITPSYWRRRGCEVHLNIVAGEVTLA